MIAPPVNLGCGSRFRHGWLNLDLGSTSPEVVPWDLRRGLPIESGTTPFVYSSHLLEHFTPDDAESVLRDIHRALDHGGIVRIVVPDLAQLARWYLDALDAADQHPSQLEWSRLHLLDQMVRRQNGGSMLRFLRTASSEDLKHAIDHMGSEGELAASAPERETGLSKWVGRLKRPQPMSRALARVKVAAARGAAGLLLGPRGSEAFDAGWFATSGERHQWMYDAHNLALLLKRCGFGRVEQLSAHTSLWPEWTRDNLDVDEDGRVYKPDSLYMEGVKE